MIAFVQGAAATAAPGLLTAPPPMPLERSVALSIARGDYGRKTINLFLPWNQGHYKLSRYGLTWAASPEAVDHALSLTEIFWAYTRVGNSYSYYPGLDPFITKNTWNPRSEDDRALRLDYTNPKFAPFIAEAAGNRAREYGADGVFLDWWNDSHPGPNSPSEVNAARRRIAKAIRAANGPDFLIIGNTNWQKDRSTHGELNGAYLEMFKSRKGPYTSNEIREIEDLLEYHDRYLSEPKIVALEAQRITQRNSSGDRATAENITYAKLFAAMAVVIPRNGYFLYADNNRDKKSSDHHHYYYDFYDIDLGKPKSGRTKIADGIGYRAFELGIVVYNRLDQDVTVTFKAHGTASLGARSGAFCRYILDGLVCE